MKTEPTDKPQQKHERTCTSTFAIHARRDIAVFTIKGFKLVALLR